MDFTKIFNKLSPGEKRFFLITCIISFIVVSCWIIFAPNGVVNYRKVRQELQAVQSENLLLSAENEQLKIEIEKLKSDPAYLEEIARKNYGLVKKNEMVFDFE